MHVRTRRAPGGPGGTRGGRGGLVAAAAAGREAEAAKAAGQLWRAVEDLDFARLERRGVGRRGRPLAERGWIGEDATMTAVGRAAHDAVEAAPIGPLPGPGTGWAPPAWPRSPTCSCRSRRPAPPRSPR